MKQLCMFDDETMDKLLFRDGTHKWVSEYIANHTIPHPEYSNCYLYEHPYTKTEYTIRHTSEKPDILINGWYAHTTEGKMELFGDHPQFTMYALLKHLYEWGMPIDKQTE